MSDPNRRSILARAAAAVGVLITAPLSLFAQTKGKEKCPSCNGNGKCKQCDNGTMRCNRCNGSGVVDKDKRCPACNGQGNFKCNTCQGNGRCIKCNGTGQI